MIEIHKSQTADTRSCDFVNVSKTQLLNASYSHIEDVRKGLDFFREMLQQAAIKHDADKITDLDSFHADFITGFAQQEWWTRHRKINRHHLTKDDGIPEDVNLIDVLDYIADCVMAGMARTGQIYALELPPELLQRAFHNTVTALKNQVVVVPDEPKT